MTKFVFPLITAQFFGVSLVHEACAQEPSLPSWNSGAAKWSIINSVQCKMEKKRLDFVPFSEMIAVFDKGCTHWTEKLLYSQGFLAIDDIHALAYPHDEREDTQTDLNDDGLAPRHLFRLNFIHDDTGKPPGIYPCIGCRPIAALGNACGDSALLE